MRVAFVGMGRHGKDECCRFFSEAAGLSNAGTLSRYLAPVVAAETGETTEEAYKNRHLHRDLWKRIGDEYRKDDLARLIRDALAHGDVTGGIRGLKEIKAARSLFSLIVWVHRPGFPSDPTMEYGPEEADVVIRNTGSLNDLDNKCFHLAQWLLEETGQSLRRRKLWMGE